MKIGKPTHLKLNNGRTACGQVGVCFSAYDPRDCDCESCRGTAVYKAMMSFEKVTKKQHNAEVLRRLLDRPTKEQIT